MRKTENLLLFVYLYFHVRYCIHAHLLMLRSAGVFSFLSRFCLFGMVSGLFNIIVDNLWLLWETLLSPLFCGYMGTLGVFVFKGLLGWGGGEGVSPRLCMTILIFFYSDG